MFHGNQGDECLAGSSWQVDDGISFDASLDQLLLVRTRFKIDIV